MSAAGSQKEGSFNMSDTEDSGIDDMDGSLPELEANEENMEQSLETEPEDEYVTPISPSRYADAKEYIQGGNIQDDEVQEDLQSEDRPDDRDFEGGWMLPPDLQ
ncbi:hypothetical protein M422DRAFT_253291 [Sphaerobolus stellatus SS14]|uniref:Uncharacterized protein n=1 Tax=Sphaerobolus stellatus (strain SS14) TaxID=990650 RepID=A0A0C9V8W6_SPHS4|nr:hypothetical protein M422DRAFT_253291 [Sphaerobolus stellatus SS14]